MPQEAQKPRATIADERNSAGRPHVQASWAPGTETRAAPQLPKGLLAHAAMADAGLSQGAVNAIAHCATLTAAREDRLGHGSGH